MSQERARRIAGRNATERRANNTRVGRAEHDDPLEGTGKVGDPNLEPPTPQEEADYMREAYWLGGRDCGT